MKKIISIAIAMLCLLMIAVPAFAVEGGSPTVKNEFLGNVSKDDISTTDDIYCPGGNHVAGTDHTDDYSNGGFTIISVAQNYAQVDTDGTHSIHTGSEGKEFQDKVEDSIAKAYKLKNGEYFITSIVDIHLWGETDFAPTNFTVKADVKAGELVLVRHKKSATGVFEEIPQANVTVGNGTITVTGVSEYSLWSFTKIGSRNTSEYVPPRTDVQ